MVPSVNIAIRVRTILDGDNGLRLRIGMAIYIRVRRLANVAIPARHLPHLETMVSASPWLNVFRVAMSLGHV